MALRQKLKRELVTFFSRTCVRSARNDYLGLDLRYPILYGMGRGYVIPKERTMGHLLEAMITSKPGAVIDVGANVGVYLVKLRVLDADRQYVGFEPNPACVHYINELVRLNRFRNCTALPLALGTTRSIVTLDACKLGDKTGHIVPAETGQEVTGAFAHAVLSLPGDEAVALANPERISVIKIDVEGGELDVLRGLEGTLRRYRPYLYVEIWSRIGAERIGELLTFLASMDYAVLGLAEDNVLFVLEDADDFLGQHDPNYILVPRENRRDFAQGLNGTPIRLR